VTDLPPQPDTVLGPPPAAPKKKWPRSTKIAIAIIGSVIVLGIIGALATQQPSTTNDEETDDASSCRRPAAAWLATLQSGFYSQYRDAPMTALGYVEADTSEGKAYYVAVTVEGVNGVAVFGTSAPPLQSGQGLIAAANPTASQLSELGADIPEDSHAGALLLDDAGTSAAESCGQGG
jgi:hypothetical protein